MQQLIYFFQRYRYFLFFLLLEFVALAFIINNYSFHKSKFVNSANSVIGGFYNKISSFSDYFQLSGENKELANENVALKNKIDNLLQIIDTISETRVIDTTLYHQQYSYINGRINNNQYSGKYNFLTINLGLNDSVSKEMGVINGKGIIGITEDVSANYTRVQSILNLHSSINARFLKDSFHFGSLIWDGKDYNIVQLLDIPRQAIIKMGDTIVTGGNSSIFPEGIPIGIVLNVEDGGTSINKIVNIQLFNDMSNLKNIYVIRNFHKEEIRNLESGKDE